MKTVIGSVFTFLDGYNKKSSQKAYQLNTRSKKWERMHKKKIANKIKAKRDKTSLIKNIFTSTRG